MNNDQNAIILVKPSEQHKEAVLAYKQEFIQSNDSMDGAASLGDAASFEEWLQRVHDEEGEEALPEGYVPASQYLAIRKADNKLVGMVNIRHRLDDGLLVHGGHIGYSVPKSERRKGYATEILRQALAICKQMGIDKALLTCNKDNIGSAKVIMANGGVLQDEIVHEDRTTQRYWIAT